MLAIPSICCDDNLLGFFDQYPQCCKHNCDSARSAEKESFAELIKELSEKFRPQGLLVSAALFDTKQIADTAYDIPKLSKYTDWISLKQDGPDDTCDADDESEENTLSEDYDYSKVEEAVDYWIDKGAAPEKLTVGIYTFGWGETDLGEFLEHTEILFYEVKLCRENRCYISLIFLIFIFILLLNDACLHIRQMNT